MPRRYRPYRRNWNPPASLLRERLLTRFGGVCTYPACGTAKRLEFAHTKPTGLNGRSRGSRNRYYDVLRHPDCYRLLCHRHHRLVDGPWGEGRAQPEPEPTEAVVPF